MSRLKVAADIGSGFTKFTDGKTENNIPSLTAPYINTGEFGIRDDEVISFKDKSFLTGKSAYLYASNNKDRLSTLSHEWPGSEGWLSLIYRVIGELGIKKGEIDFITGLPQKIYATKREEMLNILKGEHKFTFKGVEHTVTLFPSVIPQASATLFYLASLDNSIVREHVGCIDIGTYTTGVSVIDEMNFIHRQGGGVELGMSEIYKTIQMILKGKDVNIDESKYAAITKDRKYKKHNVEHSIADEISQSAETICAMMMEDKDMKDKWPQLNDIRVFLTGGGAEVFYDSFKRRFPYIELMDNSFYAVVNGMHIYLTNIS